MYGYLWCGVDSVWHREASSRSGAHARMKGSRPLARATSPTLASPRGIVWPALCAAPSRAVPRVSTGALPHNNKMLRQPKGAGSCQARRSVSAAGRIRPRSGWRISACISLRLSRGPRLDRGVGTAYASQGIQMHQQTGRGGVAGMRRPARNPEAGRMALPRAGLKANGIN